MHGPANAAKGFHFTIVGSLAAAPKFMPQLFADMSRQSRAQAAREGARTADIQHTMRFGSTAKVLLKCKLKYYRISECSRHQRHL